MPKNRVRFIWPRTVTALSLTLLSGIVVGHLSDMGWGLALVGTGVLILLWRHLRQLSALLAWLSDPSQPVPEGSGVWQEAFDGLYRLTSRAREDEQSLSAQLVRFQNAVLAMPDGITVLDANDHIEWCNPTAERDLGIDLTKDAGQPMANLVRQPDFVRYLKQRQFDEPLTLRLARGDGLTLNLRVVPYGKDQKLLLSRDVTQTERIENMRRDFLANVSHELKTPLTVVSGFLELLAEGKLRQSERRGREAIGLMQEQARRMAQLMEDLLTLSSLESSSGLSDETAIDMAELFRAVRAEGEALSAGRHVFSEQFDGPAGLLGSERELRSAFGNILSNAVRYTPAGGSIRLIWTRSGEGAAFSVADSGAGIEAGHIPRLTERFYRVDSSRSRNTGGTGLGLAIVKHVLSRHQASLEIESEPGRGSTFTAVFPARRAMSALLPPAASRQSAAEPLDHPVR